MIILQFVTFLGFKFPSQVALLRVFNKLTYDLNIQTFQVKNFYLAQF